MRLQIDNLYRSALRGYGAPAVEVGGSCGNEPTKPELIRYAQFGALMPVMMNGGSNGGLAENLPWCHDEETVRIYRYYATLHSELGDYLFSNSVDGNRQFKSIVLEPNLSLRQHLLGPDLFVSLIAEPGDFKHVHFPDTGTWIDWWDQKKTYQANQELRYHADLTRAPFFVRVGAILPMAVKSELTGNGDARSAGKSTIIIFPGGASQMAYKRPMGAGVAFEEVNIGVDEATGRISLVGPSEQSWRFRIKCFVAPTGVRGADAWNYDPVSQWLTVDKVGSDVDLTVEDLHGYTRFQQVEDVGLGR